MSGAAAAAAATNLVEVFVDGDPIMVEPGTTVLQVPRVTVVTELTRTVT